MELAGVFLSFSYGLAQRITPELDRHFPDITVVYISLLGCISLAISTFANLIEAHTKSLWEKYPLDYKGKVPIQREYIDGITALQGLSLMISGFVNTVISFKASQWLGDILTGSESDGFIHVILLVLMYFAQLFIVKTQHHKRYLQAISLTTAVPVKRD